MEKQSKGKLSIALKIFLVAASFALPIGVLVWLVIENINVNREIAVWEIKGCVYQLPLENLLKDLQDHELAFHAQDASQLALLKNSISKDVQDLEAVNDKYGIDLQFTAEGLAKRKRQAATIPNLKTQWSDVLTAITSKVAPADVDAKYDAAVATVQTMITHMGDTSNIILDPVLDTYYLGCNTLGVLPGTQDRIFRTVTEGRDLIQKGSLTAKDRTDMAVFAALLTQTDHDVVNSNFGTSLNENKNTSSLNSTYGICSSLQADVPSVLKEYNDASDAFVALTTQLASSETPSIKANDYIKAGVNLRAASFKLEELSLKEFENMLNIRIAYFDHRRTVALSLAALALLIASFIAYMITRSIVKPLNKLALTLGPGATLLSGCVEQISQAFKTGSMDKDTTTIICDELDAHATDMKKTVVQLETVVFGKPVSK